MKTRMVKGMIFRMWHGNVDNECGKSLWQRFDIVVVGCIVLLAVILGVLNNLRFADERKVRWFGTPADRDEPDPTKEVAP